MGGEPARPAAVRPARREWDAAGRGPWPADRRLRHGPRQHALCRDRPARGQPERGEGEDDAPQTGLCRHRPGAVVRRLSDTYGLPGRRGGHRDRYGLTTAGEPDPPSTAGGPAGGDGAGQDRRPAQRSIGPSSWTPHWFRHSHATALLLAGTPEWVVSRRLGHAHVQTTLDLYGWVREDEALRAAANWKSYIASWQVTDGR
ncbi:tyrosine-type recombinase/integrase [Streptomyces sp. S1D4-11]